MTGSKNQALSVTTFNEQGPFHGVGCTIAMIKEYGM